MYQRSQQAIALIAALTLGLVVWISSLPEPPSQPTPSVRTPLPLPPTQAPPAPTPTNAVSGDRVVVTFAAYQLTPYTSIIAEFNAQHPHIFVQYIDLSARIQAPSSPIDYRQQLENVLRSVDTAEIDSINAAHIAHGTVHDLTPFIDTDATVSRDDFYADLLSPEQTAQGVVLLPAMLRVELLSYNKQLFSAHSLPAPHLTWEWSDVLAAAEQLVGNQKTNTPIYGLLDDAGGIELLRRELAATNMDLLTLPRSQVRFDHPTVVTTLTRLKRLFDDHILFYPPVYPDGSFLHSNDYEPLIVQGQLGMWPSRVEINGIKQNPQLSIGTVPYPRDSGLTDFYFFGYSIGGETRHPAEAWQWLSFLSRQRVSYWSPDDPGFIPARRSIAEQKDGYWSSLDAETTVAVKAILARQRASVRPLPVYPPDYSTDIIIGDLLLGACRAVISEHKPVEQALGEAQAEWERQQTTDK
jgi:ABC-type glycerol-3-phosphate transport system substrate-binding protein